MLCTNSPYDDGGEIKNSNVQIMMTTKDGNIIEEDENISTSTTTTTSLHSFIRKGRCKRGSCSSSDEDTDIMSPCMSFDNISEVMEDPSTSRRSSSSSSSSASWSTYEYIDLRYTFISNFMFLAGASIQTYTSIIDLKASRADALIDDDGGDDDYVNTFSDKMYYVLNSLGPFLYILNACIDIRWQLDLTSTPLSWLSSVSSWCQCRVSRSQEESTASSDSIHTRDLTMEEEEQHQQQQFQEVGENFDSNNDDDEISLSTIQSVITSSFESTDATYWGLLTAFIFGIGATFELYSTFLDDHYEGADDWDDDAYLIKEEMKRPWYVSNYKIGFIGMNLYLLSGIVELLAQRKSYRSGCNISMICCRQDEQKPINKPKSVELESTLLSSSSLSPDKITKTLLFLGTFLFVCGTLLDCTIALLYDPEARHDLDPNKYFIIDDVVLDTCSLISSLLWNVDAVFYIIADVLLYSLHKEDSKARRWLCGGDTKKAQSSSSSNNNNDSNTAPLLFEKQQNYSTL
jgi:hypothetical protein